MNDHNTTPDARRFDLELQAARISALCTAAQCVLSGDSLASPLERQNTAEHLMECAAEMARAIADGDCHA